MDQTRSLKCPVADWYADDWVQGYTSLEEVEKMKQVPLRHTMQLGQRYQHHMDGGKLGPRYVVDKAILERSVSAHKMRFKNKTLRSKSLGTSQYTTRF